MISQLLVQFAVASVMVVVCVGIHGVGLASLNHALKTEAAVERLRHIEPLSLRGSVFTLSIVVALIALHGLEIWLYALIYLISGATENFESALYYSTISYSTVGYSDAHNTLDWRLLGAFESITGVILLGWSTAFFFRMLSRIDDR